MKLCVCVGMAALGCAYVTDGLLRHADVLAHHHARVPRLLRGLLL